MKENPPETMPMLWRLIFILFFFSKQNIPADQRILDPRRGPIRKTAAVKNLPRIWGEEYPFDMATRAPPQYKDRLSKYEDLHYKDKRVVRPSHLYNGNFYTGKIASLYWIVFLNDNQSKIRIQKTISCNRNGSTLIFILMDVIPCALTVK